MMKWNDVVINQFGGVVKGASVTVKNTGLQTSPTIYSDNGTSTVASSTVTADSLGRYSFYVAAGRYDLNISGAGITAYTESDILVFDPHDTSDGAAYLAFLQSGTGAVSTDLQSRGRLIVYPQDYMSAAQKADVAAFTGSLDVSAAILAAYTALPSSGGLIKFPPGKYKVDFTGADVVSSPLVTVSITKSNVFIEGSGDSTIINMTGITAAQLNSGSADPSSAGNDVATVFNFNTVAGGGVSNIRFTGTGGGTAITSGKARAKGVGVYNSQRIQIHHVTGASIPGNLINLRGDTGSEATASSYCTVAQCIADTCSENGINFMSGTYKCSLVGSICNNNQFHGFESSTTGLTCVGNSFKANTHYGIAHVSSDAAITGNTTDGNTLGGIAITDGGSDNVVAGNRIKENGSGAFGVVITGTCDRNVITANNIRSDAQCIIVNSDSNVTGCTGTVVVNNRCRNISGLVLPIQVITPATSTTLRDNHLEGGIAPIPTLTIASGVITAYADLHSVDTEAAAASDDLDTINGGYQGRVLTIGASNSARTVVVKDGTGNMRLAGDMSLDNADDTITLMHDGTAWREIGRADNAA